MNRQLSDPINAYVKDLKQLLEESEGLEQKAFLESFVERIEVGESEARDSRNFTFYTGW
jgi:hypothetical protein